MQLKKIIVLIVLVFSLSGLISVAYAYHSWNGYHWARTSNPFTLNIVDSVTAGWNSYLGTTSTDWSASDALNTAIVSGDDSNSTRKKCSAVLGKNRVCNATYGNNGWLGIARIWVYSDGHIAQGVVKVNDSYFNTTKYNTPAWRNLVMCQEVGHTLGLGHTNENFSNVNEGTCMDYTNAPAGGVVNGFDYGLSNEHPNLHDYDMLLDAIMYGHSDSTNTTTSSIDGSGKGKPVTVGQDIDLDNPSAWGKAVKQDAQGKNSLYVRDLGRGEKVFTFVTWVQ